MDISVKRDIITQIINREMRRQAVVRLAEGNILERYEFDEHFAKNLAFLITNELEILEEIEQEEKGGGNEMRGL